MDVNDLKGLFVEVNKRMNAATDHVRHELSGVRTGRADVRPHDRLPAGAAISTAGQADVGAAGEAQLRVGGVGVDRDRHAGGGRHGRRGKIPIARHRT